MFAIGEIVKDEDGTMYEVTSLHEGTSLLNVRRLHDNKIKEARDVTEFRKTNVNDLSVKVFSAFGYDYSQNIHKILREAKIKFKCTESAHGTYSFFVSPNNRVQAEEAHKAFYKL